jgi:BirA family biotin operon repressor/biotin-[acetyl-CoA-carboxylase] ligase
MKNYGDFIIHEFDELESTNLQALNLARNKQIFEKEIIVAGAQTKGRGRMERSWQSPKGNLYFSLVLQPKVELVKISQISFIAAVALRKALEGIFQYSFDEKMNLVDANISAELQTPPSLMRSGLSQKVQNKWPNDILVNGKKIGGILIENDANLVVLGVGVNVLSNPQNTIFPAANLAEFGVELLPQKLLEKFLDEFEIFYKNWLDFGFVGVRNSWLQGAFRLGEEIKVNLGKKVLVGGFEDLDLEGNLVVRVGGEVVKVFYGDVC